MPQKTPKNKANFLGGLITHFTLQWCRNKLINDIAQYHKVLGCTCLIQCSVK